MLDVIRIAIFGTESTGKTRLAEGLARHFGEPWAPEFVRDFWALRDGRITAAELETIARGQVEAEEAAVQRAKRIVFFDTDLLTCTIWDDLLFPGACPAWVRREAEQRAARIALYLLCDADVPFVPDPQRSFPDTQAREHARGVWRDTLVSRGLPFVAITGDWAEREATAIAAVERVLRARSA